MLFWNFPSCCPNCKGREFEVTSPLTRVQPGYEMTFRCKDQVCRNEWAITKLLTGPPPSSAGAFIVVAKRPNTKGKGPGSSIVTENVVKLVFATGEGNAAAAAGFTGGEDGIERVDVYELSFLLDRCIRSDTEDGKDGGKNSTDKS